MAIVRGALQLFDSSFAQENAKVASNDAYGVIGLPADCDTISLCVVVAGEGYS